MDSEHEETLWSKDVVLVGQSRLPTLPRATWVETDTANTYPLKRGCDS